MCVCVGVCVGVCVRVCGTVCLRMYRNCFNIPAGSNGNLFGCQLQSDRPIWVCKLPYSAIYDIQCVAWYMLDIAVSIYKFILKKLTS